MSRMVLYFSILVIAFVVRVLNIKKKRNVTFNPYVYVQYF